MLVDPNSEQGAKGATGIMSVPRTLMLWPSIQTYQECVNASLRVPGLSVWFWVGVPRGSSRIKTHISTNYTNWSGSPRCIYLRRNRKGAWEVWYCIVPSMIHAAAMAEAFCHLRLAIHPPKLSITKNTAKHPTPVARAKPHLCFILSDGMNSNCTHV